MSAIKFPDENLLSTIKATGKLTDVLQLFANILVSDPAGKWVPDFCKDWLCCTDAKVDAHKPLRVAVFHAILKQRVLVNSPVETYWDIVRRFGPTNQTAVVDYLNAAPKSVPLKIGRLLLAKAEFGMRPMSLSQAQQVIAVLFSSPAISQGVITREWLRELANMRSAEADLLTKMGKAYAPDGPVYSLVALFPQINANTAHFLLAKTGESVEELTQKMLDIPDFVSTILNESDSSGAKPKKYVVLDDEEKQRRADALRQKRRLEFSYKYSTFEDEDPDPEAEDAVHQDFSEADKKLVAQEQLLWSYWHQHRDVFDRQNRKSELRKELKGKLKWTDEQIEGWGRVSARSSADIDKESFNLPKHVKEVESYAPTLRSDGSLDSGVQQTERSEPSAPRKLDQKHPAQPRQKPAANKNKKEAETKRAGTSRQGSEKPENRSQKSTQQKKRTAGARKSGKSKGAAPE